VRFDAVVKETSVQQTHDESIRSTDAVKTVIEGFKLSIDSTVQQIIDVLLNVFYRIMTSNSFVANFKTAKTTTYKRGEQRPQPELIIRTRGLNVVRYQNVRNLKLN